MKRVLLFPCLSLWLLGGCSSTLADLAPDLDGDVRLDAATLPPDQSLASPDAGPKSDAATIGTLSPGTSMINLSAAGAGCR